MQKLATVEKVIDIGPIEEADFIQKATVLGWELVIKKDEFKVGDLAGYIQIDTVVPETEQFEFLRERKFRVRTIKLRKQVSQGLLVPLPPGEWNEGDDITEILGVKKYSKDQEIIEDRPPIPKVWYRRLWYKIKFKYLVRIFPGLKTFNRASFPTKLVPITDEERIQNMPQVLEQYRGKRIVISEKLDGSSITIIHEKKGFRKAKYRICSRRFELFNTKNEWHNVFISTGFSFHISQLVEEFQTNDIIVQGEYIGKPQGNKYRLSANEIRLFNIYVKGKRLKQDQFYEVCEKYNIPCCPKLEVREMDFTLPGILQYAEGKSVLHKAVEREGIVVRCLDADLSFKVISNKFLLKNEE